MNITVLKLIDELKVLVNQGRGAWVLFAPDLTGDVLYVDKWAEIKINENGLSLEFVPPDQPLQVLREGKVVDGE